MPAGAPAEPVRPPVVAEAAAAAADDSAAAATAEVRVGRVVVRGNVHSDSVRVVRTFDVLPGTRYADDAVRRGIRKLFALGLFSDVAVDRDPHDGTMDLVIRVVERPRIEAIQFEGNKKHDREELEKKLTLRTGEVYSPVAVQTQVDSLLKFYRDDGFARVAIEAAGDSAAGGGVTLRFLIHEGEKVRITGVRIEGGRAFAAKRLRKQLKTHARGFFGGGEVRDEEATEDQERLERFYHNHGYRDMRMTSRELQPTGDPRRLVLVIGVEEGPLYRVGTVAWSGNHVLSEGELAPLWRAKPNEVYDASKIEKVQGSAYGEYAEKGYLYVGIEPQESVRDSGRVDITYAIGEGRPSAIRYVTVTGNTATREKVIRRELSVHEGDRFRRSALVRTQGDLSRLGLFEEVVPDFSFPIPESTDVDINIRVKEKQMGTASAGAGYTALSGLTGFIELGHNNVFGNAQTLALHLERGSLSNNYSLSFTEPWFHDTPTLLGFSAFNTMTELDLYKQKTRGGSARIGRPLTWPDYSHGSIGYSLEDVTVSQKGTSLSEQDSIVLGGIAKGRPVRTSSLLLSFLRNSTDNAFYPTRGTRLSWTGEFAGGPFLGAVNYIKHRFEGRLYLPSVRKNLTTMLRAEVGVLGIWEGQHRPVPTYERFRLGGGTVPYPLRGYDDYQIVPEKFITEVSTGGIKMIDSLSTPGVKDTIYYRTKVRYPGGRYMAIYTVEQQFPIVHPLHGVVFFDAGNTWDQWREIQPFDLKMSAGIGFRMEIPMLGNIGFDIGYGFNRDDGARAKAHFLMGNVGF